MLLFYAVAGALALVTGLALAGPILRGRGSAETRAAQDARLYRDQLGEIERDCARGLISGDAAKSARAEISRRLLAAAARAEAGGTLAPAPRLPSGVIAAAALIGAPSLAFTVYLANGSPDMPDRPHALRQAMARQAQPSQHDAEAAVAPPAAQQPSAESEEFARLIAQLEEVLAARPDDVQGLRLLAGGYARLGRNAEAWRAYERLVRLVGADSEPNLLADQLGAMVAAAGGYVSPEARAVLAEADARIPDNPMVRYYGALALAQAGEIAGAVAAWEKLRAESPPDAPWLEVVDAMLAEAHAMLAPGITAPVTPGPGADDVAAAAELSPDERQTMIESMVMRLETRLGAEGGSVEEWVRLINALVQLGRPEDAQRVYGQARAAITDRTEAGFLREQALLLGVPVE